MTSPPPNQPSVPQLRLTVTLAVIALLAAITVVIVVPANLGGLRILGIGAVVLCLILLGTAVLHLRAARAGDPPPVQINRVASLAAGLIGGAVLAAVALQLGSILEYLDPGILLAMQIVMFLVAAVLALGGVWVYLRDSSSAAANRTGPAAPAPQLRPESVRYLNALSLYVADIDRAREFYQRVFDAPVAFQDQNNVVIRFDNILLNLLHMSLAYDPTSPDRDPLPLELHIWVEDVDATYTDLAYRGVQFHQGPTDQPWGNRTATFFDPDGHRIEIAQSKVGA